VIPLNIDWELATRVFQAVGFYTLGFTLYAGTIFFFYKHVSRRLLIEYRTPKVDGWQRVFANVFYDLKYLLLSPLILLVWAVIIASMVFLLGKGLTTEQALFAAIALLATVRITAYFNEDLATDVAKLVPLSLLGIMALDTRAIDLERFWEKVQTLPEMIAPAVYAFVFVVLLELVLRVWYAIAERD